MPSLSQEYENCRSEFLFAKEQRKEAERKLRSVKHNYHPIITKRKEQEEAVARFKMAEQVSVLACYCHKLLQWNPSIVDTLGT